MYTEIIISTQLSGTDWIPAIKEEIVKYLGNRMIAENVTNIPSVVVNTTLDQTDKNKLAEIATNVVQESVLIIIETEERLNGSIIDIKMHDKTA